MTFTWFATAVILIALAFHGTLPAAIAYILIVTVVVDLLLEAVAEAHG